MPGIQTQTRTRSGSRFFVAWLLLTLLPAFCLPVIAQTDTFTAGTGLWSKPSNWSLNAVPQRTNDCVLPSSSVVTSDLAGECLNFTLGGSGGTLTVTPGYLFVYGASFTNQGTINVGSGNGIGIESASGSTTTLSGGGTINFTNSGSRLGGQSNTLVNKDNSIHGMGAFGLGTVAITNQALIDANNPSAALTVQSDNTGVINSGTMQASNGGNLQLTAGFLTTPFNNTGGMIQALNGSTVTMAGYTYTGGTLSTSGTGVFKIVPANNTILNNLTSNATYQLVNGANTTLEGTITNNGTFQALQGGLLIDGAVTLKGTGNLTGGTGAFIGSFCCNPATLTNQETIQGGGTLGDSGLTLDNQGTVNANDTSSALMLVGATATNTALMEASGATLTIENTVNNSGGTIQAQNGSTVLLQSGTINGGSLTTSGTGTFQTESGTLDGTVNVPTNGGLFTVSGNNNLNLKGTINNSGTIALDPTGGCLALQAPTTIKGSGQITMAGSSDCIFAFSSTDTFTNQSTITGGGSIGDSNPMTVMNLGTIIASQNTPLTIVGGGSGFTNHGQLFVNPGSTMNITLVFKNFAANKLTGGTYSIAGTLSFPNANIVTNASKMTLTGAAAQILNSSTNTNALQNFALNQSPLSLTLGQNLHTSAASFTNSSTLKVDPTSTFTLAGAYTQTAGTTTVDGKITAPNGFQLQGGSLFGQGTIAASVTASGTAATTVGDSASKAGKLSVSSYSQSSANALNVIIAGRTAGTQYSQLASSNGVSLSGTLNIKRINFVPRFTDVFTIITGSVVTGKFTTVNGLTINASEKFQVNYNPTSVTLTVVP